MPVMQSAMKKGGPQNTGFTSTKGAPKVPGAVFLEKLWSQTENGKAAYLLSGIDAELGVSRTFKVAEKVYVDLVNKGTTPGTLLEIKALEVGNKNEAGQYPQLAMPYISFAKNAAAGAKNAVANGVFNMQLTRIHAGKYPHQLAGNALVMKTGTDKDGDYHEGFTLSASLPVSEIKDNEITRDEVSALVRDCGFALSFKPRDENSSWHNLSWDKTISAQDNMKAVEDFLASAENCGTERVLLKRIYSVAFHPGGMGSSGKGYPIRPLITNYMDTLRFSDLPDGAGPFRDAKEMEDALRSGPVLVAATFQEGGLLKSAAPLMGEQIREKLGYSLSVGQESVAPANEYAEAQEMPAMETGAPPAEIAQPAPEENTPAPGGDAPAPWFEQPGR